MADTSSGQGGLVEAAAGLAGPPQAQAACVFHCASCRCVLGDTTAFVAAFADLKALVLSELSLSQDGADAGSTYNALHCTTCKSAVGRVYRTTARHLDDARDAFSFNEDAISTYQLGTGPIAAPPQPMTALEERVAYTEEQIVKIQNLILLLSERLPASGSKSDAPGGAGAASRASGKRSARGSRGDITGTSGSESGASSGSASVSQSGDESGSDGDGHAAQRARSKQGGRRIRGSNPASRTRPRVTRATTGTASSGRKRRRNGS